jgi:hypothetical protein
MKASCVGYASIGYASDSHLMVGHRQEVGSENPWLKLTRLTWSFWNRRRNFPKFSPAQLQWEGGQLSRESLARLTPALIELLVCELRVQVCGGREAEEQA